MKKVLSIFLVFLMIFSGGCVEKNKKVNSYNKDRNYLIYNIDTIPKDLIMLNNRNEREEDLLICLFDGLVTLDKEGKVVPELVEKWEVSNDGISYKFHLKNNIYWSNGEKIIASDFVEFFKNILTYRKDHDIKNNELDCIYGAQDYINKGNLESLAIKGLDDETLEIRLNSKCPYFLKLLAKPQYKLRKIDSDLKDYNNYYKDLTYTGAFIIDSMDNDKIVLKKNNRYWDRQKIKSDKIVLTSIKGSENSLAALKTSQIDAFVNPPISEIDSLTSENLIKKRETLQGVAMIFNKNHNDIDEDLRKSIGYCIDRGYICKDVLCDTATPAKAYIPNYIYKNNNLNCFYENKNINKAKEYFNKSKWNKSENTMKIISLNNCMFKNISDDFVKNVKKNLNINIDFQGYDDEVKLKNAVKNGDYDLALIPYKGSYNGEIGFLQNWRDDYNKEYNDILESIDKEENEWKRQQLIIKAQNVLLKDNYIIPIVFFDMVLCKKSRVKDIYINNFDNVIIKNAYKAPLN